MKSTLTALLILSFVSIGIFGVLAMHPDSPHAVTRCLAALSQGAACPEDNVLNAINFHLGTVKNFVSVILIFGVILFSAIAFSTITFTPSLSFEISSFKLFQNLAALTKQRFGHWLALQENSPNAF